MSVYLHSTLHGGRNTAHRRKLEIAATESGRQVISRQWQNWLGNIRPDGCWARPWDVWMQPVKKAGLKLSFQRAPVVLGRICRLPLWWRATVFTLHWLRHSLRQRVSRSRKPIKPLHKHKKYLQKEIRSLATESTFLHKPALLSTVAASLSNLGCSGKADIWAVEQWYLANIDWWLLPLKFQQKASAFIHCCVIETHRHYNLLHFWL